MKQYSTVLLCLTVVGLFPAFAQPAPSFSINDVLSAPYCSNLTAGRNRVAWVVTTEGVRTIWTATIPGGKPTRLTRNATDDGQDLGELRFSPDDRRLVYVRGGGNNGEGLSPNPTSDPAGTEQAIYVVPTNGSQKPTRVAVGSNPVWSPDGTKLLFGRGGQIHVATLPAGKPVTTRKLFSVRGSVSDFSPSPDGTKVLFVSNRGYHNLVGVYAMGPKTVTWLAPGVDRDAHPVWSPDGRQVAFIRQPGQKHGELENVQGGNRFAIWTADVLTGEGRELWHSPGDDGGFAQYYPEVPLRWTENKLLFFSEHEGWMHVYATSSDGRDAGRATELTPGKYDVEETDLSPDGKYLYYSSNNPIRDSVDVDRRHIWRVNIYGGFVEPMTLGQGIETNPVLVGDYLVYRRANWYQSTGVAYRKPGYSFENRLGYFDDSSSRFPYPFLRPPRQVVFKAADGTVIHGQLFTPRGAIRHVGTNHRPSEQPAPVAVAPEPAAKHPALIFLHGGPMRQMLLGWHYRGTYYAHAYAMNQYLASRGYVVLSVNYRAGIGYGRAFRRADKQGPRGASEYQDVLAGAKYLQGRADVDPLRIGLWGGSYGGYLTALGLARNSDLFAAGVDLHGVHDWAWRGNHFSPGGGWGIGPDEAKVALESSPNHNLDGWRSPCLFVHGDDDRNVTFAETVDLVQKLRDRHVPTEVLILPDEVHSFLLHKTWIRTYQAMDAFFGKHLLNQPVKTLTSETK